MTVRRLHLAVTVTCLVAALSYAGSVTTWALTLFVLPGVVGAGMIASLFAAYRLPGTALIVGGVVLLGWAELANISTGTSNGPAARSTFFAAGCTLLAIIAASSPRPALFLVPVAGSVAGALILGAGGEVPLVAVATAVCAALTLGWLERSRRNWTAPQRRGSALLLLSLLVGAVAIGVVLLQAQSDSRRPAVLAQGHDYPGIKPAWGEPLAASTSNRATRRSSLPGARRLHPPTTSASRSSTGPRPHQPTLSAGRSGTGTRTAGHRAQSSSNPGHAGRRSVLSWVLIAIALFVLLLALVVAARLLAVRLAWRRVRRRLAVGAPAEQVTGAWAWTRMRLEACRLNLAVHLSPDLVAAGAVKEVPGTVFRPLQALAASTTAAAFAFDTSVTAREVSNAWRTAGRTEAAARKALTRSSRVRVAFRGPTGAQRGTGS